MQSWDCKMEESGAIISVKVLGTLSRLLVPNVGVHDLVTESQ